MSWSFCELIGRYSRQSSANRRTCDLRASGRSFMWHKYWSQYCALGDSRIHRCPENVTTDFHHGTILRIWYLYGFISPNKVHLPAPPSGLLVPGGVLTVGLPSYPKVTGPLFLLSLQYGRWYHSIYFLPFHRSLEALYIGVRSNTCLNILSCSFHVEQGSVQPTPTPIPRDGPIKL
jgi:hypothetical protein